MLYNLTESMLCGSRSKIKRLSPLSDWDYAAPDNEHNRQALVEQQFKLKTLKYKDLLTSAVYERDDDLATIQVSLKSDYPLFKLVWESITSEYFYYYLWKSSPHKRFQFSDAIRAEITEHINQLIRCARKARDETRS